MLLPQSVIVGNSGPSIMFELDSGVDGRRAGSERPIRGLEATKRGRTG
jgi:hypothetical protein